jgi:hypothetical protein
MLDPNEPKKTIMSISPMMCTVNLDTKDAKGIRESLLLQPRQQKEVTLSQFRSAELQKLIGARFIVDVTAAHEKRAQREAEIK